MAKKGNDRFCTVTEYKVDAKGNVTKHPLGSVDRDDSLGIDRYVETACAAQGEHEASVIAVQQELYGINVAAFVCYGGEIVKREGRSGFLRADELISEVHAELKAELAEQKKSRPLLKRLFQRKDDQ